MGLYRVTFDFVPKQVIVSSGGYPSGGLLAMIHGQSYVYRADETGANRGNTSTWKGTAVEWYNGSLNGGASSQLNGGEVIYYYAAIG